jgi:hypothetical protein
MFTILTTNQVNKYYDLVTSLGSVIPFRPKVKFELYSGYNLLRNIYMVGLTPGILEKNGKTASISVS